MKSNMLTDEQTAHLSEQKELRDAAFDALDKAVLEARIAGATYREIAEITGMSIPWVQQALHRADPDQDQYSKRRHPRQDDLARK